MVLIDCDAATENDPAPPLPVSERLAGEVLSLPMFPEISVEQIEYIAEVIRDFYAR